MTSLLLVRFCLVLFGRASLMRATTAVQCTSSKRPQSVECASNGNIWISKKKRKKVRLKVRNAVAHGNKLQLFLELCHRCVAELKKIS